MTVCSSGVGSARRSPVRVALAVVVALTLGGAMLAVWGPVNPNLEVVLGTGGSSGGVSWFGVFTGRHGEFGSSGSVGTDGLLRTDLTITNHSLAPVRLVEARIVPVGDEARAIPTIARVDGVPSKLAHGGSATVSVIADARAFCATHRGRSGQTLGYRVLVDARTMSGISRSIGGNGSEWLTCAGHVLPPAGRAPADATRARSEISQAFATAYDASAPVAARRASVDDAAGLDAVVTAAQSREYSTVVTDLRVRVAEIVFTAPDTARVLYDLVGKNTTYIRGRLGTVRLVDGRWKVARDTVCGDIGLVGLRCPPP